MIELLVVGIFFVVIGLILIIFKMGYDIARKERSKRASNRTSDTLKLLIAMVFIASAVFCLSSVIAIELQPKKTMGEIGALNDTIYYCITLDDMNRHKFGKSTQSSRSLIDGKKVEPIYVWKEILK